MPSAKNTTQGTHVAIIGGGIAGVALGLGLARQNVPFHIYERHPVFEEYSAGLGIRSNGITALKIVDPRLVDVFEKIVVRPQGEDQSFEIFDVLQYPDGPSAKLAWDTDGGMVHRSQLLHAMNQLLPPDSTSFGKQLKRIEEDTCETADGVKLVFGDGSEAFASVVVGCDGLGSYVRRVLVGDDHPSARAGYSHRYCYRALIPMPDAVKALGSSEKAAKQLALATKGAYVMQFPIMNNRAVSLNAVFSDPGEWTDPHRTVVRVKKEDFQREVQGWNPEFRRLIDCLPSEVDQWALFDQYEHPLSTYSRGRICVAGDAAHATTPHLGVGASFAMCDAAILSELLGHVYARNPDHIVAALEAYSRVGLPQGHQLVRLSREMGTTTMYGDPVIGNDLTKMRDRVVEWTAKVKADDLSQSIERAKAEIDQQSTHAT